MRPASLGANAREQRGQHLVPGWDRAAHGPLHALHAETESEPSDLAELEGQAVARELDRHGGKANLVPRVEEPARAIARGHSLRMGAVGDAAGGQAVRDKRRWDARLTRFSNDSAKGLRRDVGGRERQALARESADFGEVVERELEVDERLGLRVGVARNHAADREHRQDARVHAVLDVAHARGALQRPLRDAGPRRHLVVVADSAVHRVVAGDERKLWNPAALQDGCKGRESPRGFVAIGIAVAAMAAIAAAITIGECGRDSSNQRKCSAEAGAVHEEVASRDSHARNARETSELIQAVSRGILHAREGRDSTACDARRLEGRKSLCPLRAMRVESPHEMRCATSGVLRASAPHDCSELPTAAG